MLHVVNKIPLWCFLEIILKGLSNFAIALDIKLVTKCNTILRWPLRHLGFIWVILLVNVGSSVNVRELKISVN